MALMDWAAAPSPANELEFLIVNVDDPAVVVVALVVVVVAAAVVVVAAAVVVAPAAVVVVAAAVVVVAAAVVVVVASVVVDEHPPTNTKPNKQIPTRSTNPNTFLLISNPPLGYLLEF